MKKKLIRCSIKTKLFLFIGIVFLVAFILGASLQYHTSKQEVREHILNEARVLRGVLMATKRIYHNQFLKSGIPLNEKTIGFLPAYAMKQISDDYSNWQNSGLSFNNVSDKPLNPENLADPIEMEAIQFFRQHQEEVERLIPFTNDYGEEYFHYSRPIWMESYCLECHGKREDAPSTIQDSYRSAYIYTIGELRGILSIKLPVDVVNHRVMTRNLRELLLFGLLMICVFLVIHYLLRQLITQRLAKLSHVAQQIAIGNDNVVFNENDTDEIGQVEKSMLKMVDRIRKREQDLSITLDSIGDAVIATNTKGRITRMNPVAEKLTGWLLSEVIGQPVKNVFHIVNADTGEEIENPIEQTLSNGEIVHLSDHATLIARKGTVHQVTHSAAPIRDADQQIQGVVMVFNDVTEQHQLRQAAEESKRNLQSIMAHSPTVVYVKDSYGRFSFVNQKFEQLYHVNLKDIIGMTPHNIFDEEIANTMLHNDEIVLTSAQAMESEEIILHEDGPHTYTSNKFPLLDKQGLVYAIGCISTDITERIKQEEQLRRSQKMDALGKLTGGIAHDFNNILGVVVGYTELLEGALKDNSKLLKFTQQINHASERGTKLTRKLLSFSRQKSSDAARQNINELLYHEQLMLEKTLTARIKLVFDLQIPLWSVWLDSGEMQDAILNITINAMHAMSSGGQLTIKTSNERLNKTDTKILQIQPGDYVLLSLSDTGHGMDKKTQEKIFEPFYSTKGEQGTGLGLSQVYGFMERCNGVIKVYSEIGLGTRFTLYFPRYDKLEIEDQPKSPSQEVKISGSETILLVDDEPALLEMTSEILTQHGYRVICAKSSNHALTILENESIDLLLSDVVMPEMDGFQLAALVQQKYPKIKIQLASGFTDNRHVEMADDSFFRNLIQKPYKSNTLLKKIRGLLDNSSHHPQVKNRKELAESTNQQTLQPIAWTDQFKIGIDQVDEDHEILIRLVNRCIEIVNADEQADTEIQDILNELSDYTQFHFQREELLMEVCEYPNLVKHQQVHQLLANEVKQRIKQHSQGTLTTEALLHFMQDWVSDHVMGMDQDIMPYCKGKDSQIKQAFEKFSIKHSARDG